MNKKNITTACMFLIITLSNIAQNRVVLLEQFTNSGCYICANYSPAIFDYVDNNTADVVAIAYHTAFPYNDSMYHENTIESDARVSYYGVAGVPYSIVDGSYYENASSAFLPQITTIINTRKVEAPLYNIMASNTVLNNGMLNGEFVFTSNTSSNTTDSLVAYIVLVEKNVLKSAYAASPGNNTETEYGYVMRKMLPNSNGTVLINKLINESDTISFSTLLSNVKKLEELRIVAFVQNVSTKEVYNAFLSNPQITNVNDVSKAKSVFKIYPNPLSSSFTIDGENNEIIKSITISNLYGEIVSQHVPNDARSSTSLNVNISPGAYLMEVAGSKTKFIERIIITK